MNRRRFGFLLISIGTVVALFVAVLVYVQLSSVERLQAAQPRTWVAAAKVDIPERTVISESQIEVVQVPETAVPAGAARYNQTGNLATDQTEKQRLVTLVKDQYTPLRIYRGEIINRERLGQSASLNTPSYDIPRGRVFYTFPVRLKGGNPSNDPVLIALLNAVRPGDFVDIYYTTFELPTGLSQDAEDRARGDERYKHMYTRRLLQNLKVVQVGFFPDSSGKTEAATRDDRYLTFDVTPDDALTLKWLKDIATLEGNLELVLRSPLDVEPFPPSTIGYAAVSRRFGIGTAP